MELDPQVSHIYAESLLGAARREGKVDRIFEECDALHRALRKETRLQRFLGTPSIRKETKHEAINRIFGESFHPLLVNLIHVMLRNNRVVHLQDTLRLVYELVEEQRGIIPSTVTTAIELKPEERHRLQKTLEERLGLRFDIAFRVNPEILGGVILKYRNRQIDGSLRYDLHKLRERLMAVSLE